MASGNHMKAAQETYNGFIKATTWGTAICIVVVAVVVALIA
ncbi:aa3-type cytochrome c oxidase subunit IV [Novosphingobium endophyticum]|nr:aa3-type cytochrome c oxidase subunit IV [Novosphingobium endophyticum]